MNIYIYILILSDESACAIFRASVCELSMRHLSSMVLAKVQAALASSCLGNAVFSKGFV